MRKAGSVPPRPSLPAAIAPVAVLVGIASMYASLLVGSHLGTRGALALSEAALVAPALVLAAAMGAPLGDALAARVVPGWVLALALLCGGSLWALSLGVLELQYAVWRPPEGYFEGFRRLHEALRPSGPIDALLSAAAIAVVPAVCEEALFRGIVLGALLRLGRLTAVLSSAVLFGLIHLDVSATGVPALYRTPFAIAVGIVLGVLRVRTGSLVPPILAHATLNAITFAVAPWVDDPSPGPPAARPLFGAALFLGGVLTTLAFLHRMRVVDSTGPET